MVTFQVTDLKQYAYCPRVVYYSYCLPLIRRPVTYKMTAGIEAHRDAGERERRRSLRTYGLQQGERVFDLPLASEALGLSGRLDLAIRAAGETIPVEYKNSPGKAGRHFKLQLAAYGLMLEEKWGLPVRRGFLYFIPQRRAQPVSLTAKLRGEAMSRLDEMRDMVEKERMPEPTSQRRKCVACEFRRFCNDA